jgi:cyclic pyranopterin phosphate synthase
VGIIASVSRPFCQRCDRIRLTADGKILNCLFGTVEYDLRALLRSGADDRALLAELRRAVGEKQAGHLINQPGFEKPRRPMVAIGG